MTHTNYMAQLGATLIDQGFAILPIQPNTKKPGRFRRGAWHDYPEWSRHCQRDTTDHEVDLWADWPGAGVGVAAGRVIGIDIDVAFSAEVALRIEGLAKQLLGDTPAVRIGSAPKRLLVRGVGPGLAAFGVSGVLADPRLRVFRQAELLGENDNWSTVPAEAAVTAGAARDAGAFALPPGSRDAAVILTLAPGAYTAQVTAAEGIGTGTALIELYELP